MIFAAELYACLYATEFPAQALLRLRPELREKPCVVMEGEPPLEEVCSLTRQAGSLGLAHGMTRVEVETFPEITVLRRSLKEEASAKAMLLECAGTFSPRVEDQSAGGAFSCVLDIAGTETLLGPPEVLASRLHARVRGLGISACVAVSVNFHAAVACAKGLTSQAPAKVIAGGEEALALASLPLAVLDLTDDQRETFALWGIGTLGMLAALPETELIARMGQAGKRLRQFARGKLPHLFRPVEPAFTLEEFRELESAIEFLDPLLFIINGMIEQLIVRATARMLALASVSITLHLDGGTSHTRVVRPALPTNDKQLWLRLLRLDLDAHPPKGSILALSLTAEPGIASKVQLGLFSPQLPEPERLDVTLARLRSLVGEENVGRAVLQDTHAPEGFRIEPFAITPASPPVTSPSFQKSHSAIRRSVIRKLRPAEAILVTVQDQRPQLFVFREKKYVVERAYGPWLTSGDWWQASLWNLEQWDLIARTQNKDKDNALLHCCVVRDQLANRWQMAGLYD